MGPKLDYGAYYAANATNGDGGTQFHGISEAQWNALPFKDQLALMYQSANGTQPMVRPGQPGYEELARATGTTSGRPIYLTTESQGARGYLNDPKGEFQGDGFFAHAEDNQTPGFQELDDQPWNMTALIGAPLAFMGAGMLAGAGAGVEGAGTMTGLAGDESAGLAMGGAAGGGGGGGGLAALGGGGVPVTDLSIPAAGAGVPVTDLSIPAAGGAGAGTGAAGGLGSFLGSNAGNIVRGGLGLAALGGAAGGGGGGGGSGGGGGGGSGSTDANSIIEQMANANRVNQNTPFGSRNWVRGEDGRWTVNDTLNPAEQANFENVQGMNAGVTDFARQRLAKLLAAPPRSAADAPLNVRFGG